MEIEVQIESDLNMQRHPTNERPRSVWTRSFTTRRLNLTQFLIDWHMLEAEVVVLLLTCSYYLS